MAKPKVFVSHSSKDIELASKLVDDLNLAGAQAWLDLNELGAGDFQERINKALADCEWFLAVLTPNALASPWVRQEVNAANRLKHQGQIHDLIFIRAVEVDYSEVPALWGVYNIFDAIKNYGDALSRTCRALGLSSAPPEPLRRLPAEPSQAAPIVPVGLPEYIPQRLSDLGFRGMAFPDGVELIVPPVCDVPAGPFLMGSDPNKDEHARKNEQPQHTVTLAAYQIGKYPVTVAEYACFVRATGRAAPSGEDGQQFQVSWQTQVHERLDHPVVGMTWPDAIAYATWLAERTGQPWRLPSEAEWEKAARGTNGRIYPWGDAFDASRCNTRAGNKGSTSPLGSYPSGASPYGAQDMAGNVWECTRSIHKPYPYDPTDGIDRVTLDAYRVRLMRGGSWYFSEWHARAACRFPYDRRRGGSNILGFRLVLAVPSS